MKAMLFAACALSLVSLAAAEGRRPTVTPATIFLITETHGFLSVRGTWTIPDARAPGERIADPVNAVHIWCEKSTRQCFEAWARVQDGDLLSAELTPYDVTGWSQQEVTAEAAGRCATSVLTINILRNEVYRITRNGGTSPNGCKSMKLWTPLKKPVIEKLVSGDEAMKQVRTP